MLENVKYNLGNEYEFYATIPSGQRSKGGTAVAVKINTQKTKLKNNSPGSSSEGLHFLLNIVFHYDTHLLPSIPKYFQLGSGPVNMLGCLKRLTLFSCRKVKVWRTR